MLGAKLECDVLRDGGCLHRKIPHCYHEPMTSLMAVGPFINMKQG